MQRLSESLFSFLRDKPGADGLLLAPLWAAWTDVLGPEIGRLARPLGHRKRTLVLGADEPMVRQELSIIAPEILGAVNRFLGQKVFDKVSLELLSGRTPLDALVRPKPTSPAPGKPSRLGQAAIPVESAVGRCYRAYLGRWREEDGKTSGGHGRQPHSRGERS